ncbi:bifunctional peroxiredoxin/serine/threonine-protein kinase [Gimesia maris]|uniref:Alkyl hydroperoxide reductase C n=1 Tax=Gimesia maris TaxID=122 RepID=A0ABX5YPB5_9PLAN|nr:bifunctional peroxiredoxin/serine/threonine-protein kinase [Gimesia maris]EDL58360.1 2-cys peroxiredoxin [Gimesia maris DSM 8797]QEG17545.1 Alkyl hydroperoxide reductase subunit C [Gimesia maris]QGQ29391.1 bifunctional peroxiredoxin/serine/threonine-protein kinase [Gimesia maris]
MNSVQSCVVGSKVRPFQLHAVSPHLQPKQIQSEDYQGRWLALIFYPHDFSFVCPTELTGFSAEKSQFDQLNCELLGVSIDSLETHSQWLQTPANEGGVEGLRFPLASDPQGALCKYYGVWREADDLPNRGLFLIDPEGTLRFAASYDLSVGRNVQDVLRVLDALQAGGLCPANWKRADGVLDTASLLKSGRVLGHYRIVRELGLGAFGQVFEADDLRLERKVALKVISKQDDQTEKQVLREARSAAGINHPNVCTIYSADLIDTLPTIVMEYIDGCSLADMIGTGFDHRQFRRIASHIALGLAAAHEKGIVHGDLKPANILLRGGDEPVIVDFGLARSYRQIGVVTRTSSDNAPQFPVTTKTDVATESKESELDLDETIVLDSNPIAPATISADDSNGISGTPAYMSPEQARGAQLSAASDIFSLGLIFVEMLCGESVMRDMTALEIISALWKTDFVESLTEQIPQEFRSDLLDLFAMEPGKRPSAKEVSRRMAEQN